MLQFIKYINALICLRDTTTDNNNAHKILIKEGKPLKQKQKEILRDKIMLKV